MGHRCSTHMFRGRQWLQPYSGWGALEQDEEVFSEVLEYRQQVKDGTWQFYKIISPVRGILGLERSGDDWRIGRLLYLRTEAFQDSRWLWERAEEWLVFEQAVRRQERCRTLRQVASVRAVFDAEMQECTVVPEKKQVLDGVYTGVPDSEFI